MSGQWPPEWDDPEDISGEADQQDTDAETGLSEVAAYLASVPAPVMPGSVEARISAALAVEAAARAGIAAPASGDAQGDRIARPDGPVQSDGSLKPEGAADARVLGPAPARARVRRRDGRERRREREMRKIFEPRRGRDVRTVLGKFVIGPLAVCLLLVIIVLGLSHSGSSSSSSSAPSLGLAPQAAGAASSAAAASGGLSNVSGAAKSVTAAPASSAAASAPLPEAGGPASAYVVTHSGISYQPATLARQARALVLAVKARESVPSAAPTATSASSSASATSALQTFAPQTLTVPLRECILKVTGGVIPELVDRATYQGTPAYVIASSRRVWVVGLGCTAARPQVIASVPLAG
jgi:hypothetical protein